MAEHDILKLPKWVRDMITELRMAKVRLEEQLVDSRAEVAAAHGGMPTRVGYGADRGGARTCIPEGEEIVIVLGVDANNHAKVLFLTPDFERETLVVNGGAHVLVVLPRTSNSVDLRLGE